MPAAAPLANDANRAALAAIGQCIRERRKALAVSATAAAEAAGVSRVTLHRIEQGEASVTLGAYQNALAALGLALEVTLVGADRPAADLVSAASRAEHQGHTAHERGNAMPPSIRLADYPQLHRLAWHVPGNFELTPAEALGLYERHWRHLSPAALDRHERELLDDLRRTAGKGHLLV